jgi:hypothetical protein
MSRERFIALVKNPALLKADDAPFLEELLKEFPYFQTAHLLAARCYKVSDSIHLQKQIKNAAAHIIDRKVLYNLIENFQTAENEVEISNLEEAKGEIEVDNSKNESTTDLQMPEVIIADAEAPFLDKKQTEELDVDEIINIIANVEIGATEEVEKETILDNNIEQERPQTIIVDQKTVKQDLESQTEKTAITPEIVEAEIPLEKEIEIALAETIYLQDFEQNLINNAEISLKNEEIIQKVDVISQESSIKTEIGAQNENETQHLATTTDFVAWLKNLQKNASTDANPASLKPIKEGEKLIEAFMEKPIQRAKPIKQEFYSPVNMAKQSVSDNDFFVTETLAKIYIKQGNLAKAIKVYQNLSLKNPEKNNIFAAQIKILKEQLHNKTGK